MSTVLLSHELYKDGMELLKANADVIVANNSNMNEVIDDLRKAEGIILRVGKIDRDIMEKCPKIKVISRPGVGVDNIDMEAATELGIPVVVAPGTNARSVAEHAVALAYAITKNIVESHEETSKDNFNIRNKYMAIELEGHNLGLIGFGDIGKMTARLFAANDMKIHVYDPYVSQEVVENYGYSYYSSLEECLSISDVISLHMPSTPKTYHMFGKKQFNAMKEGVFIINCARGDVIDEDVLYESLNNGKVAGAAVDVMEEEPMNKDNKLFQCKNFIATPHMAALSQESAARTTTLTVKGTLAVINGEKWDKIANPEVYNHPRWKNIK